MTMGSPTHLFLRRLASLFGGVPEKELICAFVTGLPDSIRQLLRASCRMEDLTLEQLLARTRAVISDECPDAIGEICLNARVSQTRSQTSGSEPRCYACGGLSHYAKDCLSQRSVPGASRRDTGQKSRARRRNRGRRRTDAATSHQQGNVVGEEEQAPASFPHGH
ncbi:hypothetical protein M513_02344 [Trichuris suis]|uniref:CCHC-type domain-containing protein n=1 Tax=Trichuris suis TaxID=68888 RepID=A0A085MHH2_9BILA|nr:hypothetical protein M513_02344 [Trichuris suis]